VSRKRAPARTGGAGLPVPLLRTAVERELAAISLREAARQIGLSPNALRNFVRGAEPRATTRHRLERWLADRPGAAPGPSLSNFVQLLENITPDLPAREAAALGREMSELLLDAYRRRQIPPPRWVREVARHYGSLKS
jgi:hypothetical protein